MNDVVDISNFLITNDRRLLDPTVIQSKYSHVAKN